MSSKYVLFNIKIMYMYIYIFNTLFSHNTYKHNITPFISNNQMMPFTKNIKIIQLTGVMAQ